MRRLAVISSLWVLCSGCAGSDDPADDPGGDETGHTSAEGGTRSGDSGTSAFYEGYVSDRYAGDDLWICRPGAADDRCTTNLDATEILPDGTTRVVSHEVAADPGFDCFYVHPTTEPVDGLDQDLGEPNTELDPVLHHAARFSSLCRVFAPAYRQVGLLTTDRDALMPDAYADVLDAFKHYMANDNDGRPFVLMGHSQGTRHLTRVVQEEIDGNADLTDRLLSALLIGGGVEVRDGELVGGSFASLPLCAREGQTGCIVHYNTFAVEATPDTIDIKSYAQEGTLADGTPTQTACVDPKTLSGNTGRLAGSYFPRTVQTQIWPVAAGPEYDGIDTPFVLLRDALSARCVDAGGYHYYEVAIDQDAGDVRAELPHRVVFSEPLGFGMHTSDWQVALEDLLVAVEKQWASFDSR